MATGATGCNYMNVAIAGCNGATGIFEDKHLAIGFYTNQNYSSSYAIPCGELPARPIQPSVLGSPFLKG